MSIDTASSVETAHALLQEVRRKATAWLLDHLGPDGEPDGASVRNGFYRLPWTLASVGERARAAQVLTWAENHALADGDLREGPARTPFVTGAATYPLTILAHGAWVLERYDTARALLDTLEAHYQDPETGGAYMERPEARTTGRQLLYPTMQLGLTALATGRVAMADKVFGWFSRLMAAQRELPDRLFTMWSPDGLVTTPEEFLTVTDFRVPLQAFYNPGISAAFLSRYHAMTGSPAAKALAQQLLALVGTGTPAQFDHTQSVQICKFGWGSACAADIDPTGDHLANVIRMAQWYSDSQAPDGSWLPSGFLVPEPSVADAMQKTAEHLLWVVTMQASLGGRGRQV
ncbi:hypothetical protein VSH64_07210 [Amycolatopsis rhabdoformis]|uniref:Uncharacterized protein n=1 Tax=Amycolatopsis rhabdoformis TaxID=1448059 RepID=A0ABZ1ICX7_9PSEU|nr:hypothetical protein [Amycolatopsis rhabdoformis]WSE31896.1 hypothetical protein VSH64_07210 [Amycolatopsis rhabdoformis]